MGTHLSVALMVVRRLVSSRHLRGGSRPPFGGGAGETGHGSGPRGAGGVRTAADVWLLLGFLPPVTQDKRSLSC